MSGDGSDVLIIPGLEAPELRTLGGVSTLWVLILSAGELKCSLPYQGKEEATDHYLMHYGREHDVHVMIQLCLMSPLLYSQSRDDGLPG